MVRKILALLMVLMLLFSVGSLAEDVSPQNVPRIVLDVEKADADGYFKVKFIIYNATYKGLIGSLNYNIEAITPIDFETKQATTDFLKFAQKPTIAKNLETGKEIPRWLEDRGSTIISKLGLIYFLNVVEYNQTIPNSIVDKNSHILADEKGLVLYEFNFKKIADKPFDFKLSEDVKANPTGFMLVNDGIVQPFTFEIKLPDSLKKVDFKPNPDDKPTGMQILAVMENLNKTIASATGILFLNIGNYATVSSSRLKWLDKENKKVVPFIKDNRAMLPLRYIAEELGAMVSYNEETKEITIKLMETELVLTVGKKEYTNNGVKKQMDTVAEVIEGRTFVLAKVISEDLNRSIHWLEKQKLVVVTPKDYIWSEDSEIQKELLDRVRILLSH